jgi:ligand-binding sensor domain-containing protein
LIHPCFRAAGAILVLLWIGAAPAGAEWERYQSSRDGLASNYVFSIHEDGRGVMWFGTADGISRFDGTRWTTFRDELPNRGVNAIAEDAEGRLWFGTQNGGVVAYDGSSWTVYDAHGGYLPSNQVQSAFADGQGDLWFGTPAGLVRHHPADGSWHTYRPEDGSIIHPFATSIAEDAEGDLWVGSPAGASRLDPTRTIWDRFPEDPNGLARDSVLVIAAEPSGGVWFGTDQGAFRFDGANWSRYAKANSGILDDVVTNLLVDSSGDVLFGGLAGLSRRDSRTWRSWTKTSDGVLLNRVLALTEDREGNLWISVTGGGGAGLYRFDRTEWAQVPLTDFNDMTEDGAGELWFTSIDRGIYRLDRFGRWSLPPGIAWPLYATTILSDTGGFLWIGTSDGGVVRVNPERTGSETFATPTLPGSGVRAILEDRGGRIWLGTESGAVSYDSGSWTRYLDGTGGPGPFSVDGFMEDSVGVTWIRGSGGLFRLDPGGGDPVAVPAGPGSVPSGVVQDFLTAGNGDRWFATGNGLSRFDGSSWTTWPYLVSVSDTSMNALRESSDGAIWVGSIRGASRFSGGEWTHFDRNILGSENIIAVFEDDQSTIWLSARNNGLLRWNGRGWRTVDTGDGLASNLVTRIFQDSRGSLWFGSFAGLTEYRPDRTAPQTVFITTPSPLWGSRIAPFVYGGAYGEGADLEYEPSWEGVPLASWSGTVSTDLAGLSDGTTTFSVRARDWVGNVDPTPAEFLFEVDATSPTPVVSSPVYGEAVRGKVTVRGTADDPRFTGWRLTVRAAGSSGPETELAASSAPVTNGVLTTWDTETYAEGVYDLLLSVTDALGLTGQIPVSVQVDNRAPFADVTSPVTISASRGGNVYSTLGEAHLYFPPQGFERDAVVELEVMAGPPLGGPEAAERISPDFSVGWGPAMLLKPAAFDLVLPDTLAADAPVSLYRREENGSWARMGGTRSGAMLSTTLRAAGTHAVFLDRSTNSAPGVTGIVLTPRVFSPTGGFAATEVAVGFSLAAPGPVRVSVFNRAGKLVRRVFDARLQAGDNLVRWNGRDQNGDIVEDGIYLVAVEARGETSVRTLAVVR